MQAIASFGHCPARFFATADSFAQVAKMVDDGKEPPAWVTWRACELGSVVRVHIVDANFGADGRAGRILGPKDGIELAMWGEASVLA